MPPRAFPGQANGGVFPGPMPFPGQANGGQFPGPMPFPGGGQSGMPGFDAPRRSEPMPPPAMPGMSPAPVPFPGAPRPQMPQMPTQAMGGMPSALPEQEQGIPDFLRQMLAQRFNRG